VEGIISLCMLITKYCIPMPCPSDMYNNTVTGFQKSSVSHMQVHLVISEFKECGLNLMQSTNLDRFQLYEGESLNMSQMGIKCETCDIRTLKKHLFPDMSSSNIDTPVPLLYQCIKTRSIEVF
jgi:hypothetical protein